MKELILLLFTIIFIGLLNCQNEHLVVENQTSSTENNIDTDNNIETNKNTETLVTKSKIKKNKASANKNKYSNPEKNKEITRRDTSSIEKLSYTDNDTENENENEIVKRTSLPQKEKYYDYNYTFNENEVKNKDRPININISYPPPYQTPTYEVPSVSENPTYYNTTLIKNLAGTPTDQVQTNYSVLEDNRYDSWDKYYLPGYSYFPPSKWQLPRDNSYMVPKELAEEKCNVCPLVASNGGDNYLSGDVLKGYTKFDKDS